MKFKSLLFCFALGAFAFGCDDDDDDDDNWPDADVKAEAMCSAARNVQPCGGNFEGDWKFKGACRHESKDCTMEEHLSMSMTGDLSATNDSYTMNGRAVQKGAIVMHSDCFALFGVGCSDVSDLMSDSGTTVTCSGSNSRCVCDTDVDVSFNLSGKIIVEGNSFKLTASQVVDGDLVEQTWMKGQYCVDGSEMTLNTEEGIYILTK